MVWKADCFQRVLRGAQQALLMGLLPERFPVIVNDPQQEPADLFLFFVLTIIYECIKNAKAAFLDLINSLEVLPVDALSFPQGGSNVKQFDQSFAPSLMEGKYTSSSTAVLSFCQLSCRTSFVLIISLKEKPGNSGKGQTWWSQSLLKVRSVTSLMHATL